ncbi:restriction endonuclease [Streptomyces sp. NEAU-S7GS2]|uniref:restriction endonuclease n=1 Tax=Streptomyces sp. NEAU-S7GS2 TaxID=2202000 RepID=UPI0013A561C4|nr:restriction endonuclease [Streptomyces sp. NEAU-S7GS2]
MGWKIALVVVGSLGLPVVNNWAGGLPIASADPGNGFMRIQDVSASLALGLMLAFPVELFTQASYRRQIRRHREEIQRLEEENRKMNVQMLREKERRGAEWLAEVESSRAARKGKYSPSIKEIDSASPAEFEMTVRRLMERDGLKHTTRGRKVDSRVLYQINGTAGAVYEAGESMVVTNGSFTRDAAEWGARHGILLIDRDTLVKWSEDADHVYQLVDLALPV